MRRQLYTAALPFILCSTKGAEEGREPFVYQQRIDRPLAVLTAQKRALAVNSGLASDDARGLALASTSWLPYRLTSSNFSPASDLHTIHINIPIA